jgi:hypothetical protein
MDARTLADNLNYIGMEKCARKILINEKIATAEEVALMTTTEVCAKILEKYEVVSCESENIVIVKHDDMVTYSSIVKYLSR